MKYIDIKTKKAKVDHIRKMLGQSANWANRGLIRIFENQTADEQNMEDTVEHNGIGFTGVDGHIMSSFAKQILNKRTMSQKQQAIIFKKMPKYAGQLERMTRDVVQEKDTRKNVELNFSVIEDDELLNIYNSLQASIQYYECAEGNYLQETTERDECNRQFIKAVTEAERRGLI